MFISPPPHRWGNILIWHAGYQPTRQIVVFIVGHIPGKEVTKLQN
jgi:hypothetical protein